MPMSNTNHPRQGSKARFRISLLLLTGLLIAKLFWIPGRQTRVATDTAATAPAGSPDGSFTPVGKENAQVWGLAGSLLNLFSGNTPIPDERQREDEQKAADEQANQQRWGKEYEERRQEERDQKEQDWADDDRRRQADQDYHDRQQQQQQQYDQQRAAEQQRYDQQQQQY